MQVLSGPWAEGALLLRHVDSVLPLWVFGLLLFLSVCLLLLQLIVYFSWKLRQGEQVINFSCPVHLHEPDWYIYSGVVWLYKYWRTLPLRTRLDINTSTRHHIVGAPLLKMDSKTRAGYGGPSPPQQPLQAQQRNHLKMS